MEETETPEVQDSFGKTLTKQFAHSTAATAGMIVGLALAGSAITAAQKFKKNRQAKKEAKKAE